MNTNYLSHHGVLGMKWGIRRYQPYPTNYHGVGKNNPIVKAGDKVYHVSETRHENIKTGRLYVSTNKKDLNRYKEFLGKRYLEKNKKYFVNEYVSKENLISPTEKERINEFLKLNKDQTIKDLSSYISGYMFNPSKKTEKEYQSQIKKMSNWSVDDMKKDGYEIFRELLASPIPVKSIDDYFNILENKGYNSLIDDNDRNNKVGTKTPLILFNAYQQVKDMKIKEIK